MEFNELITEILNPLLSSYGMSVSVQKTTHVQFESDHVIILLTHDARENSNMLYIGENEKELHPISDKLLSDLFGFTQKIESVPQGDFVRNVATFLKGTGLAVVQGDLETLRDIRKYVYKDARNYTDQLLDQQNMKLADAAWTKGDYETFIDCLDKVDKEKLPPSYKTKYKMAQAKRIK